MQQAAVTTSKDDLLLMARAREIAARLNIPFLERRRQSLEKLRSQHNLDFLLVVEKERLVVKSREGEYFWHPSMAVPRLKALRSGQPDPMVEAMGLKEGYQVLDCTLGLGADALVAAYGVGDTGQVTGLEISPLLAFVTRWGMENFQGQNSHVKKLLGRITVLNTDYEEYLPTLPDNAYDVVYFDPMFRKPREKSAGINALRPLADPRPLSPASLAEALRVARYRVVLKEGSDSQEFARLKAHRVMGGKYSPVAYGIWEK